MVCIRHVHVNYCETIDINTSIVVCNKNMYNIVIDMYNIILDDISYDTWSGCLINFIGFMLMSRKAVCPL